MMPNQPVFNEWGAVIAAQDEAQLLKMQQERDQTQHLKNLYAQELDQQRKS